MKNEFAKMRIAIFASGSGTNAENLIKYFRDHATAEVGLVITNKPDAGVIERARRLNVECIYAHRNLRADKVEMMKLLHDREIGFIVLAGYLLLIPGWLTDAFPGKIVNIHPSLLPAHGGKGMYGEKVHQAVLAGGEKKSGITIHYINDKYDEGDIIFQKECPVMDDDTPDSLATRIHALEYEHFPLIIEKIITGQLK